MRDKKEYQLSAFITVLGMTFAIAFQALCRESPVDLREEAQDKVKHGQLREAGTLLKKLIDEDRKSGGPVSDDYLRLGICLWNQGRLRDAESFFRQSLSLDKKVWGDDSVQYGRSLKTLAMVLEAEHDFSQEATLLKQAFEIYERRSPLASNALIDMSFNLSMVYYLLSRCLDADSMLERSFILQQSQLSNYRRQELGISDHDAWFPGENSYDAVIYFYSNLAASKRADSCGLREAGTASYLKGDFPSAEQAFLNALKLDRNSNPCQTKDINRNLRALAVLYEVEGKYQDAVEMYSELIRVSPKTETSYRDLINLSRQLVRQKLYSKAEILLLEAIKLEQWDKRAVPPELLKTFEELGNVYFKEGEFSKAETILKSALSQAIDTPVKDFEGYALLVSDLGLLYVNQNESDKAEAIYSDALTALEKYAPRSSATAYVLTDLAVLYTHQKEYSKAEPFFKRALSMVTEPFPSTKNGRARIIDSYVTLLRSAGRAEDADKLISKFHQAGHQ
jgi:tetratricopeptide (TPR) repeat protein